MHPRRTFLTRSDSQAFAFVRSRAHKGARRRFLLWECWFRSSHRLSMLASKYSLLEVHSTVTCIVPIAFDAPDKRPSWVVSSLSQWTIAIPITWVKTWVSCADLRFLIGEFDRHRFSQKRAFNQRWCGAHTNVSYHPRHRRRQRWRVVHRRCLPKIHPQGPQSGCRHYVAASLQTGTQAADGQSAKRDCRAPTRR